MSILRLVSLFLLLTASQSAEAQEKRLAPSGLPPTLGVATTVVENGKSLLEVTATYIVPIQVTPVRDGKELLLETKTQYRQVIHTERFLLDEKDAVLTEGFLARNVAKVVRKDGKEVSPVEINKLFQSERVVLIFGTDEPDPYYLRILHDDVLILTRAKNLSYHWPMAK